MSDLISFNFDLHPVRAIMRGVDPWWIASDIAAVLGFKHTPHMLRVLDHDEKDVHKADTLGGLQDVTIISESGLYSAIFRSRRPEARAFRRWVTGEVLPALRRTGSYTMAVADGAIVDPAPAFDSAMLSASVAAVREARRLFGTAVARSVWHRLGLPAPAADPAGDPLAAALAAFCADAGECTIDQAAAALGLACPDAAQRVRIGAMLRDLGWVSSPARRGGRVVRLFTPATINAAAQVQP